MVRKIIIAGALTLLLGGALYLTVRHFDVHINRASNNQLAVSALHRLELYPKAQPITHIFLHSLIIYPSQSALDTVRRALFQNNMITVAQFKEILQKLYDNNFILVDARTMYMLDLSGHMIPAHIEVPLGKKPLILSLDDMNYYSTMKGDGFADKLVVEEGLVKTQVTQPDGTVAKTQDGDVIPIVDEFITHHPDFSLDGARGIIGVTGYDGILGYRTQLSGAEGDREKEAVRPVVAALKQEGWLFANHSYDHTRNFLRGDISTSTLAEDLWKWKSEVEPLVGPTNLYIGPFGQIFSPHDPRRAQLLAAGYNVLYGVGLDRYVKYFDTYLVQDRVDIDGYRLTHDQRFLHDQLDL